MIESMIAFAAARSVVPSGSGVFASKGLSVAEISGEEISGEDLLGAVRLTADLVWSDGAAKSGFDIVDFDTAGTVDDGVVAGWQLASAIMVTATINPLVCHQQK
jgi:hypothetical protein